MVIKSKISKSL